MSCHKRLKTFLDSIKSIEFKVDAGLNLNMALNKIDGNDNADEKEKMDKIFEKKGLMASRRHLGYKTETNHGLI